MSDWKIWLYIFGRCAVLVLAVAVVGTWLGHLVPVDACWKDC